MSRMDLTEKFFDDDLCPDTSDHKTWECTKYGCPNLVAELEDLAPWGTSRNGLKGWLE